jgi:hypothetical protein
MTRPLVERFWEKVNRDGPMPSPEAVARWPEIKGQQCWLFTGATRRGYGNIHTGRGVGAHHVAWFLETGRWPKANCLHKCDVRNCVRYEHLFEGTRKDNVRDMIAKGRDRFFGDRGRSSNYTAEQVAEIRRLGAPWVRSGRKPHGHRGTARLVRDLAKRFGGHVNTIKKILNGKEENQNGN